MTKLRFFSSFSFFSLLRGSISNNCSLTPIISTRLYRAFLKPATLKHRYVVALLTTVVGLLLAVSAAHAGRYEIVKGKGVEVCEAYEKNLNASKLMQPLLCERENSPQFTEFTKPEWEDIDLEKNKRLLWSVFSVFHPKVGKYMQTPMSDEDVERAVERSINLRSQALKKAQMDIDNDGRLENVLRYQDGICGVAQFTYSTSLLIQRDDKPEVDREKTDLLQQNTWTDPKTGEVKRSITEYIFNMYGVFRYKNSTYFDKADASPEERDKLYVYRVVQNRAQPICEYRFVNEK